AIDQCRNQLATDALAAGFEELFWIDADTAFQPNDIEQLRAHNLPIVCGIYPKKNQRALACRLMPDTKEIIFGKGGGLLEILYAAGGFLYTRREVYETIQRHCKLPACNAHFGKPATAKPLVPYFMPMVVEGGKVEALSDQQAASPHPSPLPKGEGAEEVGS